MASRVVLPLTDVSKDRVCVLSGVGEDVAPQHKRRMAELGIRKGCKFQVVQKTSGGAIVIKRGATRYAVDKSTATKLDVEVGE